MSAPAQKNLSPEPESTIDVHVLVEARLEDRLIEIAHHLVAVGVRRWVRELDARDALGDLVRNEPVSHLGHLSLQAPGG